MKKKTDRELALEWWNDLPSFDRHCKQMECGFNRNFNALTGREVESIWKMYVANKDKQ